MALRVKTIVSSSLSATLNAFLDLRTKRAAHAMGSVAVQQMKALIAAGKSPIKGRGAFEPYLGTKRKGSARARSYPYSVMGSYPGKATSPVNLKLSGDFLDSLTFELFKGDRTYGVRIGYSTKKSALKEQGHREGANGQPERPTIPTDGEQLQTTIQSAMRQAFIDKFGKAKK